MRYTFTFLCLLIGISLFSQSFYKYLDGALLGRAFEKTSKGYWLQTNREGLEISPEGYTIGRFSATASILYVVPRRSDPQSPVAPIVQLLRTSSMDYQWQVVQADGQIVSSPLYTESGIFNVKPGDDSTFYVLGAQWLRCFRVDFRSEWSLIWEVPFAGNNTGNMRAWKGELVVANNAQIVRFDTAGNVLWRNTGNYSTLRDLAVSDAGVHTIYNDPVSGKFSLFLLDGATGTVLKTLVLPFSNITALQRFPNGNFIWGGALSSAATGSLIKTDSSGNIIWQKNYISRIVRAVLADPDGSVVAVMQGTSGSVLYLVRIDASGGDSDLTPLLRAAGTLENNDLRLTVGPAANLLATTAESFLRVPKNKRTTTAYAIAPWLGGIASDGRLRVSAIAYEGADNSVFKPGLSGHPSSDFDRVWVVKAADIERLRKDFALDGQLNSPVPEDILTWPARHNAYYRYNRFYSEVRTPAARFPAPFTDVNGDGRYNPYEGDYPKIEGDQMAWWIMNDSLQAAAPTNASLGVEIAFSLYTFNCFEQGAGDQLFFLDYLIHHNGSASYANTYLGQWADLDIGCAVDDYVGSLPDLDGFYIYNTDAVDGQSGNCTPLFDFPADSIPVQCGMWLNRPVQYFGYINSGSSGSHPASTQDPVLPAEYYNRLKGLWRDGQPVLGGGDGLSGSFPPATHVFPGNPANLSGWSMCSANLPLGDRRVLASTGPFSFASGDTLLLRSAFFYLRNVPLPCPDVNIHLRPTFQSLRTLYGSGALLAKSRLAPVTDLPSTGSVLLDATLTGAPAYTWSTGATTATLSVAQEGTYTVTITRAFGCAQVVETVVRKPLAAYNPANTPEWQLLPNPARGYFDVICSACTEDMDATLYSAQGMPLRRVEMHQANGMPLHFETADLPAGAYWVILRQGGQATGAKCLVQLQ
jgi:hypothetical protein